MDAPEREANGPRLPLVDEPSDPEAIAILAAIRARTGRLLNLHRMMAHAPALMKASSEMAMTLRHSLLLPRPLIELVVLRTAQVLGSDYEWQQHHGMALEAGVPPEKIDALAQWSDSTLFTPAEAAALAYAECVALGTESEPALFAELYEQFSPRELVELTLLVCHYASTARFVQALRIPLEGGRTEPRPSS